MKIVAITYLAVTLCLLGYGFGTSIKSPKRHPAYYIAAIITFGCAVALAIARLK